MDDRLRYRILLALLIGSAVLAVAGVVLVQLNG